MFVSLAQQLNNTGFLRILRSFSWSKNSCCHLNSHSGTWERRDKSGTGRISLPLSPGISCMFLMSCWSELGHRAVSNLEASLPGKAGSVIVIVALGKQLFSRAKHIISLKKNPRLRTVFFLWGIGENRYEVGSKQYLPHTGFLRLSILICKLEIIAALTSED